MNPDKKENSLFQLFVIFLKVGSTSFGGFMALVSVVQDEMVKNRKVISEEVILDGISLASIMPGPLAVNVVTYIGYYLKGMKGALVSMLAVILPSFVLVVVLSSLYFEYGNLPLTTKFFDGVMPGVVAVIVVVAIKMAQKSITDSKQIVLCLLSGVLLFLIGGFIMTIGIIIFGGLTGWFFYFTKERQDPQDIVVVKRKEEKSALWFLGTLAAIVLMIIAMPYISWGQLPGEMLTLRKLVLIFGGMSFSLFGGGYVFIPAIQQVVVDQLQWLSVKEFTDGIAMGQITPGPILISAAFIGYKIASIPGALVATVAIFLPSGLLMILGSFFLDYLKNSALFKAMFKGVRPAVIGMIFCAAVNIGMSLNLAWQSAGLLLLIFVLNMRFKINATILIPLSGVLGLLLF